MIMESPFSSEPSLQVEPMLKSLDSSGWLVLLILLSSGSFARAQAPEGDSTVAIFQPPLAVRVDGQMIDTGAAWGHSGPSAVDLDCDGLIDLVVGDFGGKFRWYRNTGSADEPVFQDAGWIQADGQTAAVRIYCCVGSQARFHDLDGDGTLDLISNSYDPGTCWVFRGLPDGDFAAGKELLDKSGVPVRSSPQQQQDYQSFGSFYELVDWDNDGDLDILIGCFDGTLKLRINEGSPTDPQFATENIDVEVDGAPLRVKAHLCPVVADWDGDGRWDIVAGSDDGSVTWFHNIGSAETPQFEAGHVLVPAFTGSGYGIFRKPGAPAKPGIRSQVEVVDWNGDGKLDLLVGDFCTAFQFRDGLSDQEWQEARELVAQREAVTRPVTEQLEALRAEFQQRFPGDEVYSDEAAKEWAVAYEAFRSGPEMKRMEENDESFVSNIRPYLARVQHEGSSHGLSIAHGHVWLFTRR